MSDDIQDLDVASHEVCKRCVFSDANVIFAHNHRPAFEQRCSKKGSEKCS